MKKKPRDHREDFDRFEQFIFEMDDVLESFVREAKDQGVILDYSLDSLDRLEGYIDKNSKEGDDLNFKNRTARYLGEVFRKNMGGVWDLCVDNPKNLHYLLPVIEKFSDRDYDFCPLAIVDNYFGRRKRGMLRTAVESNREFLKKEH